MIRDSNRPKLPELIGRGLLTLLYVVLLWPTIYVTLVVLVIQWALVFARRNNLDLLDELCLKIVGFVVQALRYVLMLSNEKPYPFNAIPDISTIATEEVAQPAAEQPAAAQKNSAKNTTTVNKSAAAKKRKSATRKAPAKKPVKAAGSKPSADD